MGVLESVQRRMRPRARRVVYRTGLSVTWDVFSSPMLMRRAHAPVAFRIFTLASWNDEFEVSVGRRTCCYMAHGEFRSDVCAEGDFLRSPTSIVAYPTFQHLRTCICLLFRPTCLVSSNVDLARAVEGLLYEPRRARKYPCSQGGPGETLTVIEANHGPHTASVSLIT